VNGDAPRPIPTVSSWDFAWLAGATGVRLAVHASDKLYTVSVAGDVDHASLEVVDGALGQILRDPPARVELDLSGASFIDPSAQEMISRAQARAEAQRVSFDVTAPGPNGLVFASDAGP
jgi:hypothetical protein